MDKICRPDPFHMTRPKCLKQHIDRPLISMRKIKLNNGGREHLLARVNRRAIQMKASDFLHWDDSWTGRDKPATLSRKRAWNQSFEGRRGHVKT